MILYFSGTGNSRFVAKRIADSLNDKLVSINELLKNDIKELEVNKRMVIVVPSYFMRMPKVVENWFKNTTFKNAHCVYFIVTYYSVFGNVKKYNKALAKRKNLYYMGTKPINMPNNHITFNDVTKEKEAKEIINKSSLIVDDLIGFIKDDIPFDEYKANLMDSIMSSALNKILSKTMIKAKPFFVKDSCTRCLTCVNNCPLNNIKLENNRIVIKNNCTHCLSCISYCPVHAIEFGKKTINKDRYNIENILK